MTGIVILLGGIALVVGIITAWDLWTGRQDRRRTEKHQPSGSQHKVSGAGEKPMVSTP
jgi:uncharacterized iron-regulated membrane protein